MIADADRHGRLGLTILERSPNGSWPNQSLITEQLAEEKVKFAKSVVDSSLWDS